MNDYGFAMLPDSKDPTPERVEAAKGNLRREMEADHLIGVYGDDGKNNWSNGIHYTRIPAVCIYADDPYYFKYLKSREEVEKFIKELRVSADQAWPT